MICVEQDWQVTATDQNPVTSGHLTKYDSSSGYDPSIKLTNPLILSATYESTDYRVDLSRGGVIAAGGPTPQSDVPVVLSQDVSWSDPVEEYRIQITYTGNVVI